MRADGEERNITDPPLDSQEQKLTEWLQDFACQTSSSAFYLKSRVQFFLFYLYFFFLFVTFPVQALARQLTSTRGFFVVPGAPEG